jgi:hypothetical protein
MRTDKLATTYQTALHLAAILIWATGKSTYVTVLVNELRHRVDSGEEPRCQIIRQILAAHERPEGRTCRWSRTRQSREDVCPAGILQSLKNLSCASKFRTRTLANRGRMVATLNPSHPQRRTPQPNCYFRYWSWCV